VKRTTPGFVVGLSTFALIAVGTLLIDALHHAVTRRSVRERLATAVRTLAPGAAELFAMPPERADAEIRRWAVVSGLRVTLIAADGRVHADSWIPSDRLGPLENHLGRPEVVAARRSGAGVSERRSDTTGRPYIYAAQVVGPTAQPLGYLRLAQEEEPFGVPWIGLLLGLVVGMLTGALTRRRAATYHHAVARHLVGWSDLPEDTGLEALAEAADRRFRGERDRLAHEAEVVRAALGRVEEGVVLLDREGSVRFANAAATALLGAELAVDHPLLEAVRAPEVIAAVHDVLAQGGERHTTAQLADGAELAVRACAISHPVVTVAVVLRDVREEHQLERSRRALVADLAHELRTPLTVLTGLAEELSDSGADGELAETLVRQVAKLRAFASELEELARIESGQLRLQVEEVSVDRVVGQVLADLASSADVAGVALAQRGAAATLRTDPVRLGQVIGNLVDNGIRYNRRGGHVTVETAHADGEVRIVVGDDGLGIPAAEIGLVFQRFYRVRRQAETTGGSGLGLAIVKHLTRALGGTVNLTSREGRGTTVTLGFPA